MSKTYWKIAFAYIGIIIGAGLSSGQDLLQYFLSFGVKGLYGVVLLGILNIIFGKIMVTLGCYYRADNHEEVFSRITHPIITRILDLVLLVGSFVMGFVMVAGAGANLNQKFSIVPWQGALICTALIIFVSFLDFDKITSVLGIFTPVMILMILMITAYTYIGKSYDFATLNEASQSITPAVGNLWLSVFNYFSLCAITGVSMSFILGGSIVRIGDAEKGGFLGGLLIGIIVLLASLSLFAHIDVVKDVDMPMLAIVNAIHPLLAFIYSLTVFALIFNTAFSLYYSIARRFSRGSVKTTKILMVGIAIVGYICSFGGFKQLIGFMYPILGYMGMLLLIILFIGWMKERQNIVFEKFSRRKILHIILKKQDKKSRVTKEDKELYQNLVEISPADSEILENDIKGMAKDILENEENPKEFVNKELSVDDDKLNEGLARKNEQEL